MAIKEVVLIKVDSNANNNKFYKVSLSENDSVVTSWGRVGTENPPTKTQYGGEREFDRIVRAKKRKGYKESNIISTVPDKSSVDKNTLKKVANNFLMKDSDPALSNAISYMVDRNRHDIIQTSGGILKVDDNGIVKTPLGIIGQDSIKAANNILDKLSQPHRKSTVAKLTNEYLSLVPQKVKGRDWAETFFNNSTKIVEQKNLLRQLRSSLDWYNSQDFSVDEDSTNINDFKDVFNVNLTTLKKNDKDYQNVEKMFTKTSFKKHVQVQHLNVKNVFSLDYPGSVNEEFENISKDLGNRKLLWHGTDAGNVLSILREGLYCPPLNGRIRIQGRMFGPGVYLSSQSTKSLNYSHGYWSGTRNDRCFLFLADVIMGNEYWPNRDKENGHRFNENKAHYGTDNNGRGFNSISVKGGTCGVLNDEMIVWNTNQIRLKYLVELDK